MKYDLVIFGGGTSGIASAYISAKHGVNTLLVEKTDVLGGAITQGLVIPVMKLASDNINTEFYNDLLTYASKYGANTTYNDGNTGWFNPELLKIVLDDMLKSVGCTVLFSTTAIQANFNTENQTFSYELIHKMLSIYIETTYSIDATSNCEIFRLLNYELQEKTDEKQASSIRFILSGVDINAFSNWILEYDEDRNVTTSYNNNGQILLSTAYTWDKKKNWALAPIFEKAIQDKVLEYNDSAYFQVFSVPSTSDSIAVNAPRIILNDDEDILDPFVYSRALIQGRERIYRLLNFTKKYLKGFENAYISHISDMLGVRESYRIKGKYTYTKQDIISSNKFDNVAFACDYPIDIHSNNNNDKLEYTNHTYYVPLECLISKDNDSLYGVGRIISADFEAHSALRTQMSCFSMGEAASKDIIKKLTN